VTNVVLTSPDVEQIVKDYCEEAWVIVGLINDLLPNEQSKFSDVKGTLSAWAKMYNNG